MLPNYGDQIYHEQLIDITIYDNDFFGKHYKDIKILPVSTTLDAIPNLDFKPKAVLVNSKNKGYCRSVLDPESLEFFLANISKIEVDHDRSLIWRILGDNLKLSVLKPE